jgi:hypothetical protein
VIPIRSGNKISPSLFSYLWFQNPFCYTYFHNLVLYATCSSLSLNLLTILRLNSSVEKNSARIRRELIPMCTVCIKELYKYCWLSKLLLGHTYANIQHTARFVLIFLAWKLLNRVDSQDHDAVLCFSADMTVCSSLQLMNEVAHFHAIWYGNKPSEATPNLEVSYFSQSILTIWNIHTLVKWEWHKEHWILGRNTGCGISQLTAAHFVGGIILGN